MRTAPTSYTRNGWFYRQIKRVGNVAIYEQRGAGLFEVVRIRIAPACTLKGIVYPVRESLPSDSLWGTYGWTCHTLERAEAKMATLLPTEQQNPDLAPPLHEGTASGTEAA